MFQYQQDRLNALLTQVIRQHVTDETISWLNAKTSPTLPKAQFNTAFVVLPRKTGKSIIQLTNTLDNEIRSAGNGLIVQNWSIDRISRVWLLLQLDPSNKEEYFRTIENLFLAAEVHELVALYSSLPVFAYPEMWIARCAEGIRNNIGDVLEAIMCNNPYPSKNLDEAAWNQLVLKAIFTEKPIHKIIGFDDRTNKKLAETLSDYAHERWAADRPVNPQLWRGVGKFLNEELFSDIRKIALSNNPAEQEAAVLACYDSNYPPAKELLNKDVIASIKSGNLSWDKLAEKTKDHVLQS